MRLIEKDPMPSRTKRSVECSAAMTQRYDIEKTPEGTWDVIDVFTGMPAVEFGVPLIDMPVDEADELVDLLNLRDRKQRRG